MKTTDSLNYNINQALHTKDINLVINHLKLALLDVKKLKKQLKDI